MWLFWVSVGIVFGTVLTLGGLYIVGAWLDAQDRRRAERIRADHNRASEELRRRAEDRRRQHRERLKERLREQFEPEPFRTTAYVTRQSELPGRAE